METNTPNKKRGRPSKDFSWPLTSFTVADMVAQTGLSSVRIQQKLKLELANAKIFKIGATKTTKGRPSTIYSTTKIEQAA